MSFGRADLRLHLPIAPSLAQKMKYIDRVNLAVPTELNHRTKEHDK